MTFCLKYILDIDFRPEIHSKHRFMSWNAFEISSTVLKYIRDIVFCHKKDLLFPEILVYGVYVFYIDQLLLDYSPLQFEGFYSMWFPSNSEGCVSLNFISYFQHTNRNISIHQCIRTKEYTYCFLLPHTTNFTYSYGLFDSHHLL